MDNMSDLISREDAIEAIASRDETDGTVKVFTGRQVNQILSALPSAEAEWIPREHFDVLKKNYDMLAGLLEEAKARAIGAWIPCSERLPKENSRYLVQMSYGIMQVLSWANILEKVDDFDFYNKKHGGWYDYDSEWGYCERHEVVAWMPLPKPYREENEA